ncbi:hypothetical protein LBMAG53_08260 [Planctomycetota bacterium]|nr:hypothetical protein LBMAG53_08260 [Planctomycetota bacterium]
MLHPARRFRAPSSITAGTPLKSLFGTQAIELLAESFAEAIPGFDPLRFATEARSGLRTLGLLQRAAHLGAALARQLPEDFDAAAPLLIATFGPELTATAGNGLASFFYMPHASIIATRGVDRFTSGMHANYELTKRFTAEFSVRPFLERHPEQAVELLRRWAGDPNPHVRRLVSEGTRPRLPWAGRLTAFQRDPTPLLPLLEALKDDAELYVRRSVANHLGDIAKDHPHLAFATCRRWLDEVVGRADATARHRRWLVRHAVRLPAKQGVATALRLRSDAR